MRPILFAMCVIFATSGIVGVRVSLLSAAEEGIECRRLPVAEYGDRVAAGSIGQMAGVGWGGPTEFQFTGVIIPEDRIPEWKPEMVNQHRQGSLL